MNTIFEKLFGKSLAFLGQTCGDHWLYNRTAIAMCLRKKVKIRDGSVISLWDALHVENAFRGDDRVKELVIDAVDADTGEKIDREYIRKYSAKINEINHRLFGVYNTDDMVAAQRVALGRCILQYRQWIVPMFARRFQERRYVVALGEYEEGYYRTVLNLAAGLKNGLSGIAEVWDEFDEGQKRNVYRAIVEVSQFMLIWAIANFVDFGKGEPDRSWRMKLA
jgi:endo-1,4-beta-mannosidase